MNVFAEYDYKLILRRRVKELSQERKQFTLQRVAAKIPVQNSYLSRALHEGKTHLNEDHFFKICRMLELLPDEQEYLSLLRAKSMSKDPNRIHTLEIKLKRMQQAHVRRAEYQEFESQRLLQEMSYLFDPQCMVVHVSLLIPEYQQTPQRLCGLLGITSARLKKILNILASLEFIALDPTGWKVLRVNQSQIHFGADHPLMRTHQNLFRGEIATQSGRLGEEDKFAFMGTFAIDEETFLKIRARFQAFWKDIEPLIEKAPSKAVYQIGFDLLKWI